MVMTGREQLGRCHAAACQRLHADGRLSRGRTRQRYLGGKALRKQHGSWGPRVAAVLKCNGLASLDGNTKTIGRYFSVSTRLFRLVQLRGPLRNYFADHKDSMAHCLASDACPQCLGRHRKEGCSPGNRPSRSLKACSIQDREPSPQTGHQQGKGNELKPHKTSCKEADSGL